MSGPIRHHNVIPGATDNLDNVGYALGERRCYAVEILRCAQNDIGGGVGVVRMTLGGGMSDIGGVDIGGVSDVGGMTVGAGDV